MFGFWRTVFGLPKKEIEYNEYYDDIDLPECSCGSDYCDECDDDYYDDDADD